MNLENVGINSALICVDDYNEGSIKGRINTQGTNGTESFDNVMQFLLIMEKYLSDTANIDLFEMKKSFSISIKPMVNANHSSYVGEKATFFIKVLFRQNESWQGCVRWLEDDKEESFRSVLELLFLMNGALCNAS